LANDNKESSLNLQKLNLSFLYINPVNFVTSNFVIQTEDQNISLKPGIVGEMLNFPNPFRLTTGTTIGYELTMPMDTEIRIYNLTGYPVAEQIFSAGLVQGSFGGYNRVSIQDVLQGAHLPAGVYIYLLIHNGQVLAKEKMAVLP